MKKNKALLFFLKNLNSNQIFSILILSGFSILITSRLSDDIKSYTYFIKISIMTLSSWLSGFIFLAMFLNANRINTSNGKRFFLKTMLFIIYTILFSSPFIWVYFNFKK
jgi:hypothetical protein